MRFVLITVRNGYGKYVQRLYSFDIKELRWITRRHVRAAQKGETAIIDTAKGLELSQKTGGEWRETARSRLLTKPTYGAFPHEKHCNAVCAGV